MLESIRLILPLPPYVEFAAYVLSENLAEFMLVAGFVTFVFWLRDKRTNMDSDFGANCWLRWSHSSNLSVSCFSNGGISCVSRWLAWSIRFMGSGRELDKREPYT